MTKSRRYTVPECAGCARARPEKGGTICAGYTEPAYFWAKYGSCPGYTREQSVGAGQKLAQEKERRPSVKAG